MTYDGPGYIFASTSKYGHLAENTRKALHRLGYKYFMGCAVDYDGLMSRADSDLMRRSIIWSEVQ